MGIRGVTSSTPGLDDDVLQKFSQEHLYEHIELIEHCFMA